MNLRKISFLFLLPTFIFSCNQEGASSEDTEEPAEEFSEELVEEYDWIEKDDVEFLVEAYSYNLMISRYSTLAMQEAAAPALKEFAARSALYHTGLNSEIESMAAAKAITLPAFVGEDVEDYLAELEQKEGVAFDKAYVDVLEDIQKKVVDEYEEAADNTNDASLKNWVLRALPNLKAHKLTIGELEEQME